MKTGLIGLPNSGKTTLFNLLTGSSQPMEPFFTESSQVHLGVSRLADSRLDFINSLDPKPEVKYAEISFVDMAGFMVEHHDKSLHTPAEFFTHLHDVDALLYVVRAFENPEVMQVYEGLDPKRDIAAIELELVVADMEVADRRIEKIEKELQAKKDKRSIEHEALLKCREFLNDERPLRQLELTREEEKELRGFRFLSQKPVLVVLNVGEEKIGEEIPQELVDYCKEKRLSVIHICGELEEEISRLPQEEQAEFLREMGLEQSSKPQVIEASLGLLNLISFFTIGDKEVKAWTVPRGTPAIEAAGKIHTDMQRGFIRAEVLAYDDLRETADMKTAKEKGLVRLESKQYVVQDGDIIRFRFSV
jgi:GTP-binding protein YchF